MTFKLTIQCDNAAFEEAQGEELSRILDRLAQKVRDENLADLSGGKLHDVNGNTVGEWSVAD